MSEEHQISPKKSGLRWDWGWVLTWSCLFAINLITPIIFSSHFPASLLPGIALGIVTCWLFGLVIQYLPAWLIEQLIIGSLFLAFLQLFPVLQILAGMAAIASVKMLTGLDLNPSDASGILAGYVVTVLTGQFLLGFALAISLPFKLHSVLKKRLSIKRKGHSGIEPSAPSRDFDDHTIPP